MFVNIGKAKLCVDMITALGHEIDGNASTIAANKKKLLGLVKFEPPNLIRGVMKILGQLNYFRKFVPNFAMLTHPLCELLSKTSD